MVSLLPQSKRQDFEDQQHPLNVSDLLVMLDGILANPLVKECTDLLELGFLPLRIAWKLGEHERAGACMHKYVAFQAKAPALQCRAENRSEDHYTTIFGMTSYIGNSHVAEVVYRGDDFSAAAQANESRNHRVVVGQLLLLLQSFPVELDKMPVRASLANNIISPLKTKLKTIDGAYPIMYIDDSDVFLYLISALVDPALHPCAEFAGYCKIKVKFWAIFELILPLCQSCEVTCRKQPVF